MKLFLGSLFICVSLFIYAQPRKSKINKAVFEIGTGFNSPLKSTASKGFSYSPINFLNLHSSIGYNFSKKFTMSGLLNYHSIRSKALSNGESYSNFIVGSTMFSFDLGHIFELYDIRTYDNVYFTFGPGLGLNMGKVFLNSNLIRRELMYTLTYGFAYKHHINDNVSFCVDSNLKYVLSQGLAFDVQGPNKKRNTFYYLGAGFSFLLDKSTH